MIRVNTALRLLNVHILMLFFSMGGEEFREASKFKDMAKKSLYTQDNCLLVARIFSSENMWFTWTVTYKYLGGLYVLVIF